VRPIGGFLGKGDFGKLFDNPSLGRSPIAIENRAGWQPHGRGSAIVTNPFSNNQIGGARDLLTTNASTEWGGNESRETYGCLRRTVALRIKATVAMTRAIQRKATIIEPKISAMTRIPTATAANKMPPRMSFKRLRGPGTGEVPGCPE
jgi:hypothetical protein